MLLKNRETGVVDETEIIYPPSNNELVMYFENPDDCQDFYNKLLAWKRLKDKGLKFHLGKYENKYVAIEANWGTLKGDFSDVFTLFGGEE